MRFSYLFLGSFVILASACGGPAHSEGASDATMNAASRSTSVKTLKELIARDLVVFDEYSDLSKARVLSSTKSTELNVTNVDSIVRNGAGAAFHVLSVDGPTSEEGGGSSGNFSDTRRWLVLDSAGINYLADKAEVSKVRGERLGQLKEVFADPEGNGAKPFRLPDGSVGVAFIGQAFVKNAKGDILRYGLSENDDPLDG